MAGDIDVLLELQKKLISEDKKRLGMVRDAEIQYEHCDSQHQTNNNQQQSIEQDKENQASSLNCPQSTPVQSKTLPLIERLDLNSTEQGALEEHKQAFVDKVSFGSNEAKDTSRALPNNKMLRYGEFSPNNPELRVNAAPYLGLGEYELNRNLFLQRQRDDYLAHLAQKSSSLLKNKRKECDLVVNVTKPNLSGVAKAVQTHLKDIHCPLVQYDLAQLSSDEDLTRYSAANSLNPTTTFNNLSSSVKNHHHLKSNFLSPSPTYHLDQRLTSAQNALLLNSDSMDKPKSILSKRRTGSPRERLVSEFSHSYTPTSTFMDGFSFQDHDEELERERMKRENYQRELRMQIEEKRRLQGMREEQERREQELENKRLEQQLLRMQEEQAIEEQVRSRRDEQLRRHSEDLIRRKHDLHPRNAYRKHPVDPEALISSTAHRHNSTNVASSSCSGAASAHYSPPVSRRNPYNHIPSTSVFASDPVTTPTRYNNRFNDTSASSSYHYRKDNTFNHHHSHRMDSMQQSQRRFNTFSRYESLSRIDSLRRQDTLNNILDSLSINDSSLSKAQRRHSATQQDLRHSNRSSPSKLQHQYQPRRSSSSRYDDALSIPVLKAHASTSPVAAKELLNSVPFSSSRHGGSSEALRKLEDKWQIPAVQKNILNHHYGGSGGDPMRDSQASGRSILTQLGAIRMQLQQEQMRMDETFRRKNYSSQTKAVDFH